MHNPVLFLSTIFETNDYWKNSIFSIAIDISLLPQNAKYDQVSASRLCGFSIQRSSFHL